MEVDLWMRQKPFSPVAGPGSRQARPGRAVYQYPENAPASQQRPCRWFLGTPYELVSAPALLILDDFGLKPLQPPGPEDLYDVINERYEHGSILLTSNRAPNEWPDLFLDPLLASAGLDRRLVRAEVSVIRGPSFRSQGRNKLLEEVHTQTTEP